MKYLSILLMLGTCNQSLAGPFRTIAVDFASSCGPFFGPGAQLEKVVAVTGFEPETNRLLETFLRRGNDRLNIVTYGGPVLELDSSSLKSLRDIPARPASFTAREFTFERQRISEVEVDGLARLLIAKVFVSKLVTPTVAAGDLRGWLNDGGSETSQLSLGGGCRMTNASTNQIGGVLTSSAAGIGLVDFVRGKSVFVHSGHVSPMARLHAVTEPGGGRVGIFSEHIVRDQRRFDIFTTEELAHTTRTLTEELANRRAIANTADGSRLPKMVKFLQATCNSKSVLIRPYDDGLWVYDWAGDGPPRPILKEQVRQLALSATGRYAALVVPEKFEVDGIQIMDLLTERIVSTIRIADLWSKVQILKSERIYGWPATASTSDFSQAFVEGLAFDDDLHLNLVLRFSLNKHVGYVQRILRIKLRDS